MKKMFYLFFALSILSFVAMATKSPTLWIWFAGSAVLLGLYMGYKHERSGNINLF